jgi:uncharacterized protein (DUF885 family)
MRYSFRNVAQPVLANDNRRTFIKRGSALCTGLLVSATSVSSTLARAATAAPADSSVAFAAFLEEFTKPAPHEELPDLSADAFSRRRKTNRQQLDRLRVIDRNALNKDDNLNYRFVESILAGNELEHARMTWKNDPRVYLQFSTMSGLMDNPDATDADAAKVLKLLQSIPRQLADGKTNLDAYVPRFRELALFTAKGGVTILQESVPPFAARHAAASAAILAANEQALKAMAGFRKFVEDDLPNKPVGNFVMGKAAYERLLKEQYLLPYDSEYLFKYGREQFDLTVAELKKIAARIDPSKDDWKEVAKDVKKDTPEPLKMIEVHQEWVNKARAHVLEKKLVPIPWKERVDVVVRPAYLRKNSYYGSFEWAKAPDKDGVWVGHMSLNPYQPEWDDETKRQYMAEHDWGTVIVTAPHETYGGHHVQGIYQANNRYKLRRNFGTPIFFEGWGFYNETLAGETGFFPTDQIRFRQLQLQLWRVARVIWDVGLNTGRMTYDECVTLLSDGVGFLRWAAELEVDGSATTPGYRIGYFMGASEIMRMREEVKALRGADFTLSDFHERLLKVGNMPPSLMREGLLASYAA